MICMHGSLWLIHLACIETYNLIYKNHNLQLWLLLPPYIPCSHRYYICWSMMIQPCRLQLQIDPATSKLITACIGVKTCIAHATLDDKIFQIMATSAVYTIQKEQVKLICIGRQSTSHFRLKNVCLGMPHTLCFNHNLAN